MKTLPESEHTPSQRGNTRTLAACALMVLNQLTNTRTGRSCLFASFVILRLRKVYETKVMQCNTVYSPATTVKSVKSSSSSLKVSVKFVGPLKSKKAIIIDALGSAATRRGAYELT